MARDAVRIAQSRGLTGRKVAAEFGGGLSTRGKWVRAIFEKANVPAQVCGLLRDTECLRKENRIRKQHWQVPKKAGDGLRGPKAVRFQYSAGCRGNLTRSYLYRLMGVTNRGLRARKHQPAAGRSAAG